MKNQVGDPRFLEQIHKCIAARRALLGLDTAARDDTTVPPLMPLTSEERLRHIVAIVGEVGQRKLTQEQDLEERTVEATSIPAD